MKNNFFMFFLLAIFFASANTSYAQDKSYDFLVSGCKDPIHWIDSSRFFGTVKETLMSSFMNVETLANTVKNKGLSSEVYNLLTSNKYYEYLNECFGDDKLTKNMFVATLIMQDVFSRGIGIVLSGGILYYGGSLLKTISTMYPAINFALTAWGIVLTDTMIVKILEDHILPPPAEQTNSLKKIISENKFNMKAINDRFRAAVELELEKIESLLAGSVYNLKLETSKLVIKRQKLLAAIMLTQDTK